MHGVHEKGTGIRNGINVSERRAGKNVLCLPRPLKVMWNRFHMASEINGASQLLPKCRPLL